MKLYHKDLLHVSVFYYNVIYLKGNFFKNTMSDWGSSRSGSHKWSANSNLRFFCYWYITDKFYLFGKCGQELS